MILPRFQPQADSFVRYLQFVVYFVNFLQDILLRIGNNIFALGGTVSFDMVVETKGHITPYVVIDSEIVRNFIIIWKMLRIKFAYMLNFIRDLKFLLQSAITLPTGT